MSFSTCLVVSFAIVCGVRATLNSRSDAAAVTGSRVCAESIVEISTWNASCLLSSLIFSTAGSSILATARPRIGISLSMEARAAGTRLFYNRNHVLLPAVHVRVLAIRLDRDLMRPPVPIGGVDFDPEQVGRRQLRGDS